MTSFRSMKQIDLQFLRAAMKSVQVALEPELSYPFLFPFQLQSIRLFVLCKRKKKSIVAVKIESEQKSKSKPRDLVRWGFSSLEFLISSVLGVLCFISSVLHNYKRVKNSCKNRSYFCTNLIHFVAV